MSYFFSTKCSQRQDPWEPVISSGQLCWSPWSRSWYHSSTDNPPNQVTTARTYVPVPAPSSPIVIVVVIRDRTGIIWTENNLLLLLISQHFLRNIYFPDHYCVNIEDFTASSVAVANKCQVTFNIFSSPLFFSVLSRNWLICHSDQIDHIESCWLVSEVVKF